jgi:deoxyribodipyrimidine photo-lyase
MPRLIWFRNDLRVLDNSTVQEATRHSNDGIIGVFLLSPRQWKQHGWGPARVSFILEHLRLLSNDLHALGIPLLMRTIESHEDAPDTVLAVMREHHCQHVHAGIEFGLDEHRRDLAAARRLQSEGMELHLHHDQTVMPCTDFRTGSGNPYRVYTPFRKKWEAAFESIDFTAQPTRPCEPVRGVHSDVIPDAIDSFDRWDGLAMWSAGTAAAQVRLDHFLDGPIDSYHRDRDRPDLDGTSTLSPWLAVGSISPATCIRPLVERHGHEPGTWPAGPRTWLGELAWRDFYRHVMSNFPEVSMHKPMKSWTEHVPWQMVDSRYEAWCTGTTGIDIVDAAMRQLLATGWMHNRMRMVTAMFLTKNLLVDWRRGEAFFARHLIDYDFASNNGGWQWAASTGTDAAPYFRIFNPDRQAEVFDPNGEYRAHWLVDRPSCNPIVELKASRAQAIAAFKQARELDQPSED